MVAGVLMADEKKGASVKIGAEIHRKARTVAGWKGVGVQEYLDSILAPAIDRDMTAMMKELQAGAAEEAQADEPAPKRRKPKGE